MCYKYEYEGVERKNYCIQAYFLFKTQKPWNIMQVRGIFFNRFDTKINFEDPET